MTTDHRSPQRAKVVVGLVQINNSFSNQNYFPLSVGLLQAYAQRYLKHPERYTFLLPIYRRVPVQQAVAQLIEADVVFFSVYVWNIRISIEVARALKTSKPQTLVVFGGPQVPNRPEQDESFMRTYPFIDLACHGEGEQVTVEILERWESRNWEEVPSVSFLNSSGQVVRTPRTKRLSNLSSIPSPYLEGTFAPLMQANPSEHWIGLWETNRGCPFSCTFCDWGSATQSKVYTFDLDRLYQEVGWFADHRIEYLFCCDANFGMLPRDLDIARHLADTKRKRGYPGAVSVQNTKNATDRAYQAQTILTDAGMNRGVDIALQSLDAATLMNIKRGNISSETYQELQRRFTRDGVETYTDLILGLPGETYESFADGVSTIIENGQHNRAQFNNLSILPNAEMGDPEYQRKHGMITVETKVVNMHGAIDESEHDIYETQTLVVATNTMPKPDWVRTRTFAWLTALLHFDKVLQLPFVLIHDICSVRYRELVEIFLDGDVSNFPIMSSLRSFFSQKALDIQQGDTEYCPSREWLGMWWPADEYIFIQLCVEGKLQAFYREAEQLLRRFLEERFLDLPPNLLAETIELNRSLIKQPFQTTNVSLELSFNIWEFYRATLQGTPLPLENKPCLYEIDRTSKTWPSWDLWFKEVVWYGNRRGAYLYGNNTIEPQLAGHY